MNGKTVVLLLIGGDKSKQQKNIEMAKAYCADKPAFHPSRHGLENDYPAGKGSSVMVPVPLNEFDAAVIKATSKC